MLDCSFVPFSECVLAFFASVSCHSQLAVTGKLKSCDLNFFWWRFQPIDSCFIRDFRASREIESALLFFPDIVCQPKPDPTFAGLQGGASLKLWQIATFFPHVSETKNPFQNGPAGAVDGFAIFKSLLSRQPRNFRLFSQMSRAGNETIATHCPGGGLRATAFSRPLRDCQDPSASRTLRARSFGEKGFWMKFTPLSSTPWWAMTLAV